MCSYIKKTLFFTFPISFHWLSFFHSFIFVFTTCSLCDFLLHALPFIMHTAHDTYNQHEFTESNKEINRIYTTVLAVYFMDFIIKCQFLSHSTWIVRTYELHMFFLRVVFDIILVNFCLVTHFEFLHSHVRQINEQQHTVSASTISSCDYRVYFYYSVFFKFCLFSPTMANVETWDMPRKKVCSSKFAEKGQQTPKYRFFPCSYFIRANL